MKKLNQKQMFSVLLVGWQESAPNNKKIFFVCLFVCFACVGLTRFASQVARKPLSFISSMELTLRLSFNNLMHTHRRAHTHTLLLLIYVCWSGL